MGNCKFCGEKAGFLKSYHKKCFLDHQQKVEEEKQAHEKEQQENERLLQEEREKKQRISNGVYDSLCLNDSAKVQEKFNTLKEMDIPNDIFICEVKNGINRFIKNNLSNTAATELSIASIDAALTSAGLSVDDLKGLPNFNTLLKSLLIKDIQQGTPKSHVSYSGVPVNLQKNEIILWVFSKVKYYETKTKTEYIGGSSGVSIRIMKGVSYRVGSSKGEMIKTDITLARGTGMLIVTQKNIYFHGNEASFRIPYKKIVSFTPYIDGIGIQRDAQTAKPQAFETHDGWFTYALITGAASLLLE